MRPLPDWDLSGFTLFLLLSVSVGLTSVLGFREEHDRYPKPRFLPGESNFTYTRGDTATLLCSVAELGTKTITWRRASSLNPLTIGKMTFTDDKDYEVHSNSLNWNLLIKNVQPKHAGKYECQISTKDKMKRTVYLNVLDDQRFREPDISITGLFHVDKGQTIQLRCNATGVDNPPDAIDWFKDGGKIQTNSDKKVQITKQFSMTAKTITSELRIKEAQMADTGTYTCRTSDLQVISKNVNILNAEKPINKRVSDEDTLPLEKYSSERNGSGHYRYEELMMLTITMLIVTSLITSSECLR